MKISPHPSASPVVAGNPSLRKCCVPKCHNSVRLPERKCRSCKAASRRSARSNRSHSFTKPTAAAVLARSSAAPASSPITANSDFYAQPSSAEPLQHDTPPTLAELADDLDWLCEQQETWNAEHPSARPTASPWAARIEAAIAAIEDALEARGEAK